MNAKTYHIQQAKIEALEKSVKELTQRIETLEKKKKLGRPPRERSTA